MDLDTAVLVVSICALILAGLCVVYAALAHKMNLALFGRRGRSEPPAEGRPGDGAAPAAQAHEAPPQPVVPHETTSFIGREEDIERVRRALLEGQHALVTIAGTGGVGKTKLAIHLARQFEQEKRFERTDFIELAPLTKAEEFVPHLLGALGIEAVAGEDDLTILGRGLSGGPRLIILDNFETVLDATGTLRDIVTRAEGLEVVATSRQPLGIAGERVILLEPLDAPAEDADASPEALLVVESVQLFRDRARERCPEFDITEANAAAVAALCRTLDGLPLAIELAAAQVDPREPDLSIAAMARQIAGRRMELLRREDRGLSPREASLEACFDWSYDRLSPEDQQLFARLSVFAGGFYSEAVHAVAEVQDATARLRPLADKNLVQCYTHQEMPDKLRYALLPTLREYAGGKLGGEGEGYRERAATYFLRLAEDNAANLHGPGAPEALHAMAADLDNIRAGMDWAVEGEEHPVAVAYAFATGAFLESRGLWAESIPRLEAGVRAAREGGRERDAAVLAGNLGVVWQNRGEYARARQAFEEVRELSQAAGDLADLAISVGNLAVIAHREGDYARAKQLYEEALALEERLGTPSLTGWLLHGLGTIAEEEGRYDDARALHARGLEVARARGDTPAIQRSLHTLATLALREGKRQEARALYLRSLQLARRLRDPHGVATTLHQLGVMAELDGRWRKALRLHGKSLSIKRDIEDQLGIAQSLHQLGMLAHGRGDLEEARALYRESLRLKMELGVLPDMLSSLTGLASIAVSEESYDEGRRLHCQILHVRRRLGDQLGVAASLGNVAALLSKAGRTRDGVVFLAHAVRLFRDLGCPIAQAAAARLAATRRELGDAEFERLKAEAEKMTLDEVIEYAINLK